MNELNPETNQSSQSISNEVVDKYLQRIRKQRELKEVTIFTSVEVQRVFDVKRVAYLMIPGTVSAELSVEKMSKEFNFVIPLEKKNSIYDETTIQLKENHVIEKVGETVASLRQFEPIAFNPDKKAPIYLPHSKKAESNILMVMTNNIENVTKESFDEGTVIELNGEVVQSQKELLEKINKKK